MRPCVTDRVPEIIDGACCRLAQDGLQLEEGVLNRVEIGREAGQVADVCSYGRDRLAYLEALVAGRLSMMTM